MATTDDDPPSPAGLNLLLVSSVAGGYGDVAFTVNLVTDLLARHPDWRATVVLRAAIKAEEPRLLSFGADILKTVTCRCGGEEEPPRVVVAVARGRITALEVETLCPAPASSASASVTGAHPRTAPGLQLVSPQIDVIVQAPLYVWDSCASAVTGLGLLAATPGVTLPPPSRPIVTVREFGNAPFAAAMASPTNVDVSAGLADGEVGIFSVRSPADDLVADPHDPAPPACCYVGYFRDEPATKPFVRLVLSMETASKCDAVMDAATVHLWWLFDTVSEARLLDVLEADVAASTGGSVARPQPGVLVASCPTGSSHGGGDEDEAGGEGGHETTDAPRCIRFVAHDIAAANLDLLQFRSLLSSAKAAVVSGDQSLNEAICFRVPFFYAASGHKAFVQRALAAHAATAAPVVAAWWKHLAAADAAADSTLTSTCTELADAFKVWCTALLLKQGDLGNNVERLVLSVLDAK